MSGIGGHVNQGDRARRRDHALDQPDPWRWTDAEAVAAFAEVLDSPLFDWQYRFATAVLAPRRRTLAQRLSWHAPGNAYDSPA